KAGTSSYGKKRTPAHRAAKSRDSSHRSGEPASASSRCASSCSLDGATRGGQVQTGQQIDGGFDGRPPHQLGQVATALEVGLTVALFQRVFALRHADDAPTAFVQTSR